MIHDDLVTSLRSISGARVSTDAEDLRFFSQDVLDEGVPPLAVVRPGDIGGAQAAMIICARHGACVAPRGGGLSYTRGYLADRALVVFDLSALDRIVEISAEDMYATVEPGVTWKQLDAALASCGLRAPYWGPLSGHSSTVGGAASQNSIWWGSGLYGSVADNVLACEVLLADGSLISTGSAASVDALPFFRQYGPDLTGLFLGDVGAFGLKTSITLRLIIRPNQHRFASFNFAERTSAIRSLSAIGREQLASENFLIDPFLTAIRVVEGSDGVASDIRKLFKVARHRGLADAAQIAFGGRAFAEDIRFGHHVIVEAHSAGDADARLARVRELAVAAGGIEIPANIPKVTLAEPFPFFREILGSHGERWAPRHVLVPHSRAVELFERFEVVLSKREAEIEAHDIRIGTLCCTSGSACFLFEVQFFWPDKRNLYHDRMLGDAVTRPLTKFDANPVARRIIDEFSDALVQIGAELGGVHLQVGRIYPLKATRKLDSWLLLKRIKNAIDPEERMNPSVMGL